MLKEQYETQTHAEASKSAQQPVVSLHITEESADALYKLLNSISITRMQEFGLSFEEAQLVSRINPNLC